MRLDDISIIPRLIFGDLLEKHDIPLEDHDRMMLCALQGKCNGSLAAKINASPNYQAFLDEALRIRFGDVQRFLKAVAAALPPTTPSP